MSQGALIHPSAVRLLTAYQPQQWGQLKKAAHYGCLQPTGWNRHLFVCTYRYISLYYQIDHSNQINLTPLVMYQMLNWQVPQSAPVIWVTVLDAPYSNKIFPISPVATVCKLG